MSRKIIFIVAILDVILLLFAARFGFASETCFTQTVAHSETTVYNWYYKPRTDGLQPQKNAEMQFVYDMGGYSMGDPEDKVIYLTFDAGYENGYTKDILDTLSEHDVTAAFFLVGHYINSSPGVVRRMVDEGHLVCNHTMTHQNMGAITDFEAFKKELCGIEDIYNAATGEQMAKFFRPPSGAFSERCIAYANDLGYTTVFWSFAYKDWLVDAQPSPDAAFETIISRTHPGEIVLLHMCSSTNAAILGDVIEAWREMGYHIESLDYLAETYDPTQ